MDAALATLLPSECPNCGRLHAGYDFNANPGPVQAELSRLGALYSCGYATGRGQNCGKCQQCLLVHEHFLKEAYEQQKAELSRLREQRDEHAYYRKVQQTFGEEQFARAEAAEARCARLQQALEDAVDVAEWLTGLMEIPMDSAWPTEMRPKLNNAILALAGLDTPADSQEDKT